MEPKLNMKMSELVSVMLNEPGLTKGLSYERKSSGKRDNDRFANQSAELNGQTFDLSTFYGRQHYKAAQLLNSKRNAGLTGQLTQEDLDFNNKIDEEVNKIYTTMGDYDEQGTKVRNLGNEESRKTNPWGTWFEQGPMKSGVKY